MHSYQIHGDNIVECERTLDLIAKALRIPHETELYPTGSPLTPTYTLITPDGGHTFNFTLLPGFGRWAVDIREMIRKRGGRLREAADAIVCLKREGNEEPVLAIEYSGALPAGNQAWQRNGRALSFAYSDIPYMYVAELSGYELNSARERKAARMPNPAVPFSYLLLTESTKSPAIPVFVPSPGASAEAIRAHSPFYGDAELVDFVRRVLLGQPTDDLRKSLEEKVLALVKFLSGGRKRADSLSPQKWEAALARVMQGDTLPDYLADEDPLAWTKTAYIKALTKTTKKLMALAARLARGLTSSTLPMCLIVSDDRAKFADAVTKLYPKTSHEFLAWCRRKGHLAICWVMGFKPRGDDARPDRGLPPLCRMLVGEETDILTVVYGPAPAATWPLLERNPINLMKQNGLWEAVLGCSNAVLIDSSTLPSRPPLTYLEPHWVAAIEPVSEVEFLVDAKPVRVGEHDVDTVLHLLFARFGFPCVFEGLCNPPGGDWSGLSLQTDDHSFEYRWLNLPRVTVKGAKRPDHVFQIFECVEPFLVLAIESKEHPSSVEDDIGPHVVKYVVDLVAEIPSAQRTARAAWSQYEHLSDRQVPQIASAAAFVMTDPAQLESVAARGKVDIVIGVTFGADHDSCEVGLLCCSPLGKLVADFIDGLNLRDIRISIKRYS